MEAVATETVFRARGLAKTYRTGEAEDLSAATESELTAYRRRHVGFV